MRIRFKCPSLPHTALSGLLPLITSSQFKITVACSSLACSLVSYFIWYPPLLHSSSSSSCLVSDQISPWCLRGGVLRTTTAPLSSPGWVLTLLVLGWSMGGCSVASKELLRTKLWTLSRSVLRRSVVELLDPNRRVLMGEGECCFPPDTPGRTTARERLAKTVSLLLILSFTWGIYACIALSTKHYD